MKSLGRSAGNMELVMKIVMKIKLVMKKKIVVI